MTPEKAAQRMRKRADRLKDIVQSEVVLAGERATKELEKSSPRATGRLSKSWVVQTKGGKVLLVNTAPYSLYVNGGVLSADAVEAFQRAFAERKPITPQL